MNHEIDLKNYKVRTDLIVDSLGTEEKKGFKKEIYKEGKILIEKIILEEEGAKICNKKEGNYITISFEDVTDKENKKQVEEVFTKYFKKLLQEEKIKDSDSCFIVGLGNDNSTPDALGPKAVEEVLVTRHLFSLEGVEIEKGYRNVSAFAPSVMGTTGIETKDMIQGVVSMIKPDFLIIIDALASSSIDRCNKTIQMSNTGIAPGSGVGNHRAEISKDTIGIPVFVIGIPTVVDAVTIVSDTIHYMLKQFSYNKDNYQKAKYKFSTGMNYNYLDYEKELSKEEKEKLLGMIGNLSDEEMKSLIFEVLTPIGYNLMVTPKEIDFLIDKLSKIIGNGINKSLHESFSK